MSNNVVFKNPSNNSKLQSRASKTRDALAIEGSLTLFLLTDCAAPFFFRSGDRVPVRSAGSGAAGDGAGVDRLADGAGLAPGSVPALHRPGRPEAAAFRTAGGGRMLPRPR